MMNVRIQETGFRWTIKAMIKAGLLPKISHYELHMRDRLCDVVRGTPFTSMVLLHGWKRVNSSLEPTVPRGIREGLFSEALLERNCEQSTKPHSMQTTTEWVEVNWGHSVVSNLTSRSDITKALEHPAALVVENGKAAESDVQRVRDATGLTVTAPAISAFSTAIQSRQLVHSNLTVMNHALFQSHNKVRMSCFFSFRCCFLYISNIPGAYFVTSGTSQQLAD